MDRRRAGRRRRASRCSTTPRSRIACELRDVIAGGDHVIVTGAVLEVEASDGAPLVFYGGAYRPLG